VYLHKFADDTDPNGVVDMPEGQDSFQRDLNKLKKRACVNLKRFNKAKGKGLHLGWGNHWCQCRLGDEGMESRPTKKDLGVLGDAKLDLTWQCALSAQKTNRALDCIPSSVARRAREGILPLCPNLLRPPRESCVQLWSPQHRTDMELLEHVQRRSQQ